MTHDSGVSREKSSESGHGRDEVGGLERMRGAFWERESAVGGAILEGGVRRFAVAIAEVVCIDWLLECAYTVEVLMNAEVQTAPKLHWGRRRTAGGMMHVNLCLLWIHNIEVFAPCDKRRC